MKITKKEKNYVEKHFWNVRKLGDGNLHIILDNEHKKSITANLSLKRFDYLRDISKKINGL